MNYSRPPEQPRSEPEIIPPGHTHDPFPPKAHAAADAFVFTDALGRSHRIRSRRISPFVAFAILFGIVTIAGLVLLLVVSAVLVWIPIAAAIVFGLLAYGRLRGLWQRWRRGF
jgi:hypothetical protein